LLKKEKKEKKRNEDAGGPYQSHEKHAAKQSRQVAMENSAAVV
jgi:hypothetical protein